MGTNLSQVFVANTGNLQAPSGSGADLFTDLASTPEIGIWDFAADSNDDHWRNTRLFVSNVDIDEVAGADETGSLVRVANPVWLYNDIQFAQGTAGDTIASPLINTRDIRKVRFEPFVASAGHKHTLADNTIDASKDRTFKFIVRNEPTSQLNFHDADATNYVDLSGAGKRFPLGAFNATNHKAISVEVLAADYTNFNTCMDKLADAVQANALLNDLIVVSGSNEEIYTARHAGVIIDLVIVDSADGSALTDIDDTVTAAVIGVGNDWQVLGEEIRCRSRYGNFNRMYLPQNTATYAKAGYQYHKVTIQYEHNWPNATGIAPAGALNEIVLYVGDSSTAMVAGDTTIDAAFDLANVTAAQEFVW